MDREYFSNSFSTNSFTEALSIAQELSELGGMIQGSLAFAIHLYSSNENNLWFLDREIDVISSRDIRPILRKQGYKDVPGHEYENIRKKEGYSCIDPCQCFLYAPNGFIIDLLIGKENPYRTTNIRVDNFEVKVITYDELTRLYYNGSKRKDRPWWKRFLYRLRYYQLKNNNSKLLNYLNQMGDKFIITFL